MAACTLAPRLAADTCAVGDLPLSRVLLMNHAWYPWVILVPRRPAVPELHELVAESRRRLPEGSCVLAALMQSASAPHKLNMAALGNQVPQLHLHHIVRYRGDPAWPRPVWGVVPAVPYRGSELDNRLAEVRELLRKEGLRAPAG